MEETANNCVGPLSSRSHSLRSWRDFVRECFCFGSEAVNASGEAVRGLVKSRVRLCIPPATQATGHTFSKFLFNLQIQNY